MHDKCLAFTFHLFIVPLHFEIEKDVSPGPKVCSVVWSPEGSPNPFQKIIASRIFWMNIRSGLSFEWVGFVFLQEIETILKEYGAFLKLHSEYNVFYLYFFSLYTFFSLTQV